MFDLPTFRYSANVPSINPFFPYAYRLVLVYQTKCSANLFFVFQFKKLFREHQTVNLNINRVRLNPKFFKLTYTINIIKKKLF